MSPLALRIPTRPHALTPEAQVGRVLPFMKRRQVGPFVFLDHLGPLSFAPGRGLDTPAHPHIGLSTLTWLFEGRFLHSDSLGSVQPIRPGEVNWMTAGRGIVHAEQNVVEPGQPGRVHGLQFWVALPEAEEERAPAFQHVGGEGLPRLEREGAKGVLVAGEALGARSPVEVFSPLHLIVWELEAGARLPLLPGTEERGLYVLEGGLELPGEALTVEELGVLEMGWEGEVRASGATRLAAFGGQPLGPRFMKWNYVSSRKERVEQAERDWAEGRFPAIPAAAP